VSDVLVDDAGGDSFHFDNHARELRVSRCKSYYCGGYGFFIGQGCTDSQLGGHQRPLRRQCQRGGQQRDHRHCGREQRRAAARIAALRPPDGGHLHEHVNHREPGQRLVRVAGPGRVHQRRHDGPGCPQARADRAPAQAVPVNPLPILKMTGATPDPGTTFGQYDIYGGRYVSGIFPHGETATVTADPGPDAYAADLAATARATTTTAWS
jgi:hypothetical protein